MHIFEWHVKSSDGLDLFARGWEPEGKPKAMVCLVHGLGEHVDRYEHVARALTDAGYVLLGYDLRGHGRSGGPRGHTPSYDQSLDDIQLFLTRCRGRYPGRKQFLYGHSLGGNLVINYALQREDDLVGVIATGPLLRLGFEPPAFKVALGRAMNRIAPGFTQASGLEQAALSRDPAVVQDYAADPLVHGKISARQFVSMYESGLRALENAAGFPLPLLLMVGSADRLVSPAACQEFAERADGKVTFKMWDGWYHEIHNEPENEQVLATMTGWMDKQLP